MSPKRGEGAAKELAELKDFVHKMPASYTRLHLLEMIAALESASSPSALIAAVEALRQIDADMDLLNAEWIRFRSNSTVYHSLAVYNKAGAELDIVIGRIGSNIAVVLNLLRSPPTEAVEEGQK